LILSLIPSKQLFKIDRMKYFLTLLVFCVEFSFAQPAGPLYRTDSSRSFTTGIRERLVQLALQNPQYEMADHASRAAGYQIKIAKSAYLGLLSAQGNINEFTINKNAARVNNVTYPVLYPKYNFSLNVPFDIFARTKNSTKIAEENYYLAEAMKNDKFREVKADVLTRYENYLLAKQLVEYQGKLTQGEYSSLKRAESDFAENLIKLDDLELAQKNYITEQVKSLTLQKDLNLAKIEIERVIGVKIEDVESGMK
jgi:outer membrane protein TolC